MMNLEDSKHLIEEYHSWDNQSCTCFQSAPCAKCVGQPEQESYQKAMEVVNDRKKLIADKCELVVNRYRNIFAYALKLDNRLFVECAHMEVVNTKDLLASYAGLVDIEYDYRMAEDMEEHLNVMLTYIED